MPTICVEPGNFTIASGDLDMGPAIPMRLVLDVSQAPVNNGDFSTQRALPGVNHQDVTSSWTNTYAVPMLVVPELTVDWMIVTAPQPNVTLIRTRLTVTVGGAADTPDISGEFDSQFGEGFDLTDQDPQANPEVGRVTRATPAFVIRKTPEIVNPGQLLGLKYRTASFTPDPWLANANNVNPLHNAQVGTTRLRVWATSAGPVL